jgi:hypothetical protein
MLAYPWVFFAAFAIANPLIFRWYLTPPLPFYILTILIGVESIVLSIFARTDPSGSKTPVARRAKLSSSLLLTSVVFLPLALSLRGWTVQPDHGPGRPAPEMAWHELELDYLEAANFLEPLLQEESVLAASDVGVLGYFTTSRILDTVGLNSPIALQYYPINPSFYAINLATSPDLIVDTQPDYVVLLEVYGREGLFRDERFQDHYTQIMEIPTDVYGSDGMLIFSRNDLVEDLGLNLNS